MTTIKDRLREPPRELWVVLDGDFCPNFSSTDRQTTMEHASIMAGDFPEHGPWRTCKYVAEPFDKIERLERENAQLKTILKEASYAIGVPDGFLVARIITMRDGPAKARSKALEEAAMRMHTLAEAWGTNTPFAKEKHDSFSFAEEQILALRKKP